MYFLTGARIFLHSNENYISRVYPCYFPLFGITLDNKNLLSGSHDNNLSVTNPEHTPGVKEYFREVHHYL